VNRIWATRGRTWGFRLLWTGGLPNPLEVYEAAFVGTDGAAEVLTQRGGVTAVRFPDPEGRTDRAGRLIPHEFVILTAGIGFEQIDTARTTLWAEVAPLYASVWEQPAGPSPDTLR
jgi:hypothetical protein